MTTRPPPATADRWPGLRRRPGRPQGRRRRPRSPAGSSAPPYAGSPVTVHDRRPTARASARAGRTDDRAPPARRVLRPDRPRRADRLRRGLPDRRLGAPRTSAASSPCSPPRSPTLVPRAAADAARPSYVPRPPRRPPEHRATTPASNIAHHYDLSNDLFRTVPRPDAELLLRAVRHLDRRPRRPPAWPRRREGRDRDLAEAQARKIERLLDQAGVGAGTRVLEIGTGWGELAIRAARRGATVALGHPVERAAGARRASGSPRPATPTGSTVELCDYRAGRPATYDAVVSVEMIEAVGHEYWQTYFETIDRVLAPGGRVGDPGDHDAARPDARHPAHLHVDQQVHLPRRLPALGARRSTRSPATHTALRVTDRLVVRPALRRDAAAVGRGLPRRAATRVPGARLRRDLPADVALLPGVLARRLRLGLHRRQPAHLRPRSAVT